MVELVTIMIILGILAVVAIPRMNSATSFRAVEFRDKAVAALRFAQKTAVSHRRLVCVGFATNKVSLTIDHDKNGACNNQPLLIPGSNSNEVISTETIGAFASTPATLHFQPNGQGTNDTGSVVTINTTIDGSGFYVAGATGYVGDAP